MKECVAYGRVAAHSGTETSMKNSDNLKSRMRPFVLNTMKVLL